MQKHTKILSNHNLEFESHFQSVNQIVETGFLKIKINTRQIY